MRTSIEVANWLELAPDLERVAEQIYDTFDDRVVCPDSHNVFRAFQYFPPQLTRVVILGQDPYHHVVQGGSSSVGTEQALIHKAWGLSFGYNPHWKEATNSSLLNVLKEAGAATDFDRSLEQWARQGVLLLNTRLTCEADKPMSHAGLGWEQPVTELLKWLYKNTNCVFMLWGAEARNTFSNAIGEPASETERVLITSHPCKYSAHRGFIGCDHFQRANEYLTRAGSETIKWV